MLTGFLVGYIFWLSSTGWKHTMLCLFNPRPSDDLFSTKRRILHSIVDGGVADKNPQMFKNMRI